MKEIKSGINYIELKIYTDILDESGIKFVVRENDIVAPYFGGISTYNILVDDDDYNIAMSIINNNEREDQ